VRQGWREGRVAQLRRGGGEEEAEEAGAPREDTQAGQDPGRDVDRGELGVSKVAEESRALDECVRGPGHESCENGPSLPPARVAVERRRHAEPQASQPQPLVARQRDAEHAAHRRKLEVHHLPDQPARAVHHHGAHVAHGAQPVEQRSHRPEDSYQRDAAVVRKHRRERLGNLCGVGGALGGALSGALGDLLLVARVGARLPARPLPSRSEPGHLASAERAAGERNELVVEGVGLASPPGEEARRAEAVSAARD